MEHTTSGPLHNYVDIRKKTATHTNNRQGTATYKNNRHDTALYKNNRQGTAIYTKNSQGYCNYIYIYKKKTIARVLQYKKNHQGTKNQSAGYCNIKKNNRQGTAIYIRKQSTGYCNIKKQLSGYCNI